MDSLLYKLYSGDYDFTLERGKKQQELDHKIYAEWKKVEKIFGQSFMDRLLELEGERDHMLAFRYYQEGFRLGVRLMLEALTPA